MWGDGVRVTQRRTDWSYFLRDIARLWRGAERITLVMDNLNTHEAGSLYETFRPGVAKALRDRFDFVYTPKHGSWLNMAEIELNVLIRQCLDRRIDNIREMRSEVAAWQERRPRENRLAVYYPRRTNQTEAPISDTSHMT